MVGSDRTAAQSVLDARVVDLVLGIPLDPCTVAAFAGQLAVQANIPLGFEHARIYCRPADAPPLARSKPSRGPGPTVSEALDWLVTTAPDYAYRVLDGVVVVRPRETWTDDSHFLNSRVEPFSIPAGDVAPALEALAKPFEPRAFPMNSSVAGGLGWVTPSAVSFQGGSLLSALNTFVAARAALVWHARYCGEDARGHAWLGLSRPDVERKRIQLIWLRNPPGQDPC